MLDDVRSDYERGLRREAALALEEGRKVTAKAAPASDIRIVASLAVKWDNDDISSGRVNLLCVTPNRTVVDCRNWVRVGRFLLCLCL